MHGDRWDGIQCHDWQTENPIAADFEEALLRLDADVHTLLTIATDGETHLTIAGGSGRYVVYATFDNEEFWNLLRPEQASGTVMLNAGGQVGDFPAIQVVSLQQARSAGLVFLDSGQLDPGQSWEKS